MFESKHFPFSIGGWCLVSGGADPFGEATRCLSLEVGLEGCKEAGIRLVSFHDRDLWPDDAPQTEIDQKVEATLELVNKFGLKVFNFTTNLFSNPCFRSGAFSSPFPEVRVAAIVKACKAMDVAAQMGAHGVIFWGGREGTDGSYEQDPGQGLRRYMMGLNVCIDYALEKGYKFIFTIEPKVYEPRLLGLYAGTGTSASSAIKAFFPGERYKGLIKVNPEHPQHVAMLGLDPVIELGQLLEEGMLASFIHFGGQITGRMDCDLPPGIGGSLVTDFMICNLLQEREWNGVVECDCRPIRTTTTKKGMWAFLRHCVWYWRMLESKVEIYQNDPIIKRIRASLSQPSSNELQAVSRAVWLLQPIVEPIQNLTKAFTSFEDVSQVDTDVIEAHIYRLLQILTGVYVP